MSTAKRVLGIVGSYRKGGTIDSAVSEILSAAAECGAETSKIYLTDARIEFCTNCRSCTQQPGPEPGQCVTDDDMDDIVREIENSHALVLGSPVNFGDSTAITRRFLERLLRYAYWPWEKLIPVRRNKSTEKKAVLVTSSTAPPLVGKLLMRPLRSLKTIADMLGAKPVGTLYVGLAAKKHGKLSQRAVKKARRLGKKLAL